MYPQVDIPAIGPRLPGLALISSIRALFKYDVMIEEGHRKVYREQLSSGSVLILAVAPSFLMESSSYRC